MEKLRQARNLGMDFYMEKNSICKGEQSVHCLLIWDLWGGNKRFILFSSSRHYAIAAQTLSPLDLPLPHTDTQSGVPSLFPCYWKRYAGISDAISSFSLYAWTSPHLLLARHLPFVLSCYCSLIPHFCSYIFLFIPLKFTSLVKLSRKKQ